jgi:hypothetical protein
MISVPSNALVILLGIVSVDAFLPTTVSHSTISTLYMTTTTGAKKTVFIDGEAGTTGIQVRDRLGQRDDLEILSIPDELRKDVATRKQYINQADAVILCTFLFYVFDD